MPYDVASPWAAAAGALGGYVDAKNKKKQLDIENARNQTLDQQVAADSAARLGLERSNQEATAASRKVTEEQGAQRLAIERGNADRAQGEADARAAADAAAAQKQKLIDTFQGQGLHYPKNWDKMKPEEKIGYLQVRLNAAQKAGDQKTVGNTETEINRVATEAEQARRDAATAKQRDVTNARQQQSLDIRVHGGTGGSDKPLTRYQQIELDHWNKLHLNPDGSLKTNTKDTSGLSSIGNLQYQKDVRDWMMGGQDPANEPDPTSAKYPKKAAGGGNTGGGGARKAMGGYQIGHAYGNLQYLGGDPNDKTSWK